MSGIQRAMLSATLIAGFAIPAIGQSDKKFEAFGTVGMNFYPSDVADTGMDYGGGFGLRPFSAKGTWKRGWELEFNLSIAPANSDIHTQTRYTANVLYHFLSGRVQPYALIGAGGYYEPGDSSPPLGSPYTSRNQFLTNAGGGVRILVNDRWSIRPEFRGFALRDRENFSRIGVFVGYHLSRIRIRVRISLICIPPELPASTSQRQICKSVGENVQQRGGAVERWVRGLLHDPAC
jgi:opacity protein-like surface antigen